MPEPTALQGAGLYPCTDFVMPTDIGFIPTVNGTDTVVAQNGGEPIRRATQREASFRMIMLLARRLDPAGTQFEFKIFDSRAETLVLEDAAAALSALQTLGVSAAEEVLARACEFGIVEVAEPDESMNTHDPGERVH